MKNNPPIIIIGMKESGAENVAKILESRGLFIGYTKNSDNEAVHFHNINTWILREFSSGRENPLSVVNKLVDLDILQKLIEHTEKRLNTRGMHSFLGWANYLIYRSPTQLKSSWGWYDSINIITLPIWLGIFPNAKIIHVYRNPKEVIKILTTKRSKRISELNASSKKWYQSIYWYLLTIKYIPDKVLVEMRCSSPEEALTLWEEYFSIPKLYSQYIDSNDFMDMKYDDLVESPQHKVKELIEFCNFNLKEINITDAVNLVTGFHLSSKV